MTEHDDELPPRIVPPNERATREVGDGRDWKQYEHSGAYTHGDGALTEIEQGRRLPPGPYQSPVDWLPRALWALIAAAVLAFLWLAGYVWHEIATHTHHAAAPVASGQFRHAGYAFALVCVVAAAFIIIRVAARWLSGR